MTPAYIPRMMSNEPPPELKEDVTSIENRFSPGPADQRNQAPLRHPERPIYRCFLTDLAGFTDICRVGPDYADRQDRKKTGLSRSYFIFACSILKRIDTSSGAAIFYSCGGQMSSKILADQQAIFLLHLVWNLAAIRENSRFK